MIRKKRKGDKLSPMVEDLFEWGIPRLIGAGYGLMSTKTINPRWPEFMITAFVIGKYREKSSFWFMILNAVRGSNSKTAVAVDMQNMLAKLVGSTSREVRQLSALYRALREEKGAAVATAAVVEIIKMCNIKRTASHSFLNREGLKTVISQGTSRLKKRDKKTRRQK